MACFHPLDAWQLESGAIVFAERGSVKRPLQIACGQCVGCKLERSRQWAVRCMHESSLCDENSFITLTYDDEHLPIGGYLVYRHFQLFMKRLRREVSRPVRFYAAGEYTEGYWRPHFHALIFGFAFSDRKLFSRNDGYPLYSSGRLDRLWGKGFCTVGDVSVQSAGYVARYAMKKVNGQNADVHYTRVDLRTGEVYQLPPEFAYMSNRPGVGADWFRRFSSDVYKNHDFVVVQGRKCKPPAFYDRMLRKLDGDTAEAVEYERYKKSLLTTVDSSPERLRVREIVTRARVAFLARDLE